MNTQLLSSVKTPCYIIDERRLTDNLTVLKSVSDKTGCRILLAQKAFSNYSLYPLIGKYLIGTTASSLHEARLGYEEMGGETHIFSAAYRDDEFDEILKYSDHIVFNSFSQLEHFIEKVRSCDRKISVGIRVNPEYAEIETDLYNPCFKGSRLGVTKANFKEDMLDYIDGIHFHTMCEQNSDTLKRTVKVVEEKFGKYLYKMKWLNFGGGHHITRSDYDIKTLIETIVYMRDKYDLQIYLEPGEAVALNAGYLVTSVLDIVKNDISIAVVDASAACHMPDVLEMPYRPAVDGSGTEGEKEYSYRLGSTTCLAGDIIGDYSFDKPLNIGSRLVFNDMAIYTTVKNNTFNGINLPSIYLLSNDENIELIRDFGYEDFKSRL